jgi:hypothetical protein
MKKAFMALTLILALTVAAGADIYIKQKVHSDGFSMMGQSQPATDGVSEQWIGDTQFAMLSEKQSSIVDLKKNVMYLVNHANKTYIEAKLPFDFASLLPPEVAQMMAGMMKMTVSVAPNGQKKTIGQWNCDGYDVTITMMMPLKMTVWATKNVPFDLNAYFEKVYGTFLKAQFKLDETAVAEMKKVQGFWIASETNMEMMGQSIKSSTEVVEISKKTPPPTVYAVPPGYTKQDKLSMKDLQGR